MAAEEYAELGEVPAAAGSALSSLRDRREKARQELFKDLPIPRLDPPVYVRFRPLKGTEIATAQKRGQNSADKEAVVNVNAGLIAAACRGVFEVIDGAPVSIDPDDRHGDWPLFGERLAELLGLRTNRAAEVVRGLYLTDGDIIATVGELVDWSGYTTEVLDRETAGN